MCLHWRVFCTWCALISLTAAAVPFEEDERDPSIWFLDHSYLENMAAMFKKVNGASWHARLLGCVVLPPTLVIAANSLHATCTRDKGT